MRYLRGAIVFVLLLACASSDELLPPVTDRLAAGTWGGADAGIRADSSVAHVHIGCTLGNFAMPIVFDASKRFNVTGSYVLRAYPVQMGPELPARMEGQLQGNRLTFSVTVNDTVEKNVVTLGPVTVIYAREPAMQNCPICVR